MVYCKIYIIRSILCFINIYNHLYENTHSKY
nr:MAG TPA: hypothetical protein [Bacteriophage sp.]